ncbi:hypothetical protein IFR04_008812 [Cadophora malorum]|uniref:Uncharacterized protein n=1 Tax=Cadophora malorum TaxID=108018 RepID=A0A8H7W5P4_9HELO|nr:hypothetical protein IFR04_008812 [Cadophora malorum]
MGANNSKIVQYICVYLVIAVVAVSAGTHVAGQSPKPLPIGIKGPEHLRENTYVVADSGFYIKSFNGTVTEKAAAKFAKDTKAHIPVTIVNPTNNSMCVLSTYTDLKAPVEKPVFFSYNETEFQRLPVPSNSSVQIGNFIPQGDRIHINGRIQAFFNCNNNCTICPGDGKVRHTLVEWKYGNDSANLIYETESWWSNLSNVDGLSTNTNLTVYNAKGKPCQQARTCDVTAETLIKACPSDRYWKDGTAHGCESDCKATGLDRHCCTGDFSRREPPTCPKSSSFLKELCPDAYASPYDDYGSVDNCHKVSGVRMAFWEMGNAA